MSIIDFGYKSIVKPTLFRFNPETIHEWVMDQLGWARYFKPVMRKLFRRDDPRLERNIWGYNFKNPIGLAGGFDKNAVCTDIWELLGFSFFEIGTLTPRPQPGNPKPRLFRYPEQQALVNRMGFNNDGAEKIAERLVAARTKGHKPSAIMGVSIGKQKVTPASELDLVIDDYLVSLRQLYDYGDFFVVNVSSPNTPDLRSLQKREPLSKLLYELKDAMHGLGAGEHPKPLCVKLAPDLSNQAIIEAVDVACECELDGIIATNTTNKTGGLEEGGLSGRPLRERSTEVIRLIAEHTNYTMPIIGGGGVFSAQDAIEKLEAGAWILQIYTSFVYEGPMVVGAILRGLLDDMENKQMTSLSQYTPGGNQ